MNFQELQTYGGYIGLAIYYIYATFDKQKKQSAKQKVQLDKDSEDTAKNLIDNLKLTTEIQDKKIAAMERRKIGNLNNNGG